MLESRAMKIFASFVILFSLSPALADETKERNHRSMQFGAGAFQWDYASKRTADISEKGLLPGVKFGIEFDDASEEWVGWGQATLGFGSPTFSGLSPLGSAIQGPGAGIFFSGDANFGYRLLWAEKFQLQGYMGFIFLNSYRKPGGTYWVLSSWTVLKAGIRAVADLGQWSFALVVGPNLSLINLSTHYLPSISTGSASFFHRPGLGYNVEFPIGYRFAESSSGIRLTPYFSCVSRGDSFSEDVSTSGGRVSVTTPADRIYQYGATAEYSLGF